MSRKFQFSLKTTGIKWRLFVLTTILLGLVLGVLVHASIHAQIDDPAAWIGLPFAWFCFAVFSRVLIKGTRQ